MSRVRVVVSTLIAPQRSLTYSLGHLRIDPHATNSAVRAGVRVGIEYVSRVDHFRLGSRSHLSLFNDL